MITAVVGFWATLSLNICDFTRYARSQRAQMSGQAIGLPFFMVSKKDSPLSLFPLHDSFITNPRELTTTFKTFIHIYIERFFGAILGYWGTGVLG